MFSPSPLCLWHLAQLALRRTCPPRRPLGIAGGVILLDDDFAVGVGQPAAGREEFLGPRGELFVRMRGQRRALVKLQVARRKFAGRDRIEQRISRVAGRLSKTRSAAFCWPAKACSPPASSSGAKFAAVLWLRASSKPLISSGEACGVSWAMMLVAVGSSLGNSDTKSFAALRR